MAKDVCSALHLTNSTIALKPLDNDERAKLFLAPNVNANIISESGLYTLVLRSNKPEAKMFRKWVTSEVLPQIRRTGAYVPGVPVVQPALKPTNIKQVAAFLQVATDAYWHNIKAQGQISIVASELRKEKKAISAIISSIKEVFPESEDILEDISVKSMTKANTGLPLSVEMRG